MSGLTLITKSFLPPVETEETTEVVQEINIELTTDILIKIEVE